MVGVWIEPVIAQLMMILFAIVVSLSAPLDAFPLDLPQLSFTGRSFLQSQLPPSMILVEIRPYVPQLALFVQAGKAASRAARR
jgi:hypothetical protein